MIALAVFAKDLKLHARDARFLMTLALFSLSLVLILSVAFGPLFRDLHLMFDEFAKDVRKSMDELAERIRMIGPNIENVQLKQMQEAASVHSAGADQSMREMIEEADANLMVVIKGMRDAARIADDNNDPGTVDLFAKTVRIHEKHEWFLRQVLKKKDGLSG